ncbi:Uncharacterised protein [Mycobacteroides abscessus]|nr:Uncharacterised protein [Mycobacteroides abscessus]
MWPGVGVDGHRVELHGVRQRDRHRPGGPGQRQPFLAESPHIPGCVRRRRPQSSKVIESDRRIGFRKVDVGVQIAQQSIGQSIWHGPKLFLGLLDHRTQRRVTRHHLCPAQPTNRQRHRVLGSEPADRARQVDIALGCSAPSWQILVTAVAFHIDGDRRGTGPQMLCPCQGKGNQQDLVHSGVERRRHLTKQHMCGFGIQKFGQSSGRGECVLRRPRCGQARRDRPHLPPGPGLADHIRMPRMFGQSIRPALERRTRWRQQDLLSTTQLGRGYGQVLQQNPPGNAVNGQVMNDQHQLAGGRHPQPAQHHAGRGGQPRPCRDQCLVRKNVHRVQAVRGVDGPRLGHRQRPAAGAVVSGSQAQHAVPIEQGLQHDQDRRFRHSGRSLQHHRLIEFIDRAFNSLQPAHDRCRHHRTDALVDHPI